MTSTPRIHASGLADAADLQALREKYERMLVLREAHARARQDSGFEEPSPRPELAALAERYPGSLRELDRLFFHEIVVRIEALSRAATDATAAEPWMVAQIVFHRLARGALVAKRWLGGRRHVTAQDRARFREALSILPRAADAALFADDLDRVANPPRGRLMDVVHARVAEVLGVTEAESRALVLGPARRRP